MHEGETMKTKYKYISFHRRFGTDVSFPNISVEWICENHKGTNLGIVGYNDTWHEWEFGPYANMFFTIECVRDIADFLGQLNKEGKP